MADLKSVVQDKIDSNPVMVFSKSYCPFCKKIKALLGSLNVRFETLELDLVDNGPAIHQALIELSGQKTVPNVYIRGHHLGGCDDAFKAHQDGRLMALVSVAPVVSHPVPEGEYEYDLIVIGGGSGGIACAKEASKYGKVAVLDFVQPSPIGTKWGLGGTCVNVGCIPKKLMHTGSLLGESLQDARKYGWEFEEKVQHNWTTMTENIQNHIGSLNWSYRVQLREKEITYQNAFGRFVDPHTIKAVNKRGKEITMTGKNFVVATGMRPRYPDVPGAKEFGISSDDLFSLSYCPGKVVMIGASYVSLECAGFLAGIGLDVTVIVRSILLRGFDQEMAEKIGEHMADHGVKFIRPAVPVKVEKIEDGTPPKLKVFYKGDSDQVSEIECNTVMWAIGRDACTKGLGFEELGVKLNPKDNKVICDEAERSTVPNIYAIGDVLDGKLELTPVAIQAGILLARRLFEKGTELCDYVNVPTTVFTPQEYGSCGLSEEKAIEIYGQDNIEIYHKFYIPVEYSVSQRDASHCYAKLICSKKDNERVIGFHVLGPHAGEVTQGFAVAMKCGATKKHFDSTVGIHPTIAELFTSLQVTKSSGEDVNVKGCSS